VRHHGRWLAVLVLVASLVVGAVPGRAAAPDRRLPPPDRDDLARIFDPKVAEFGLRTTRARLQDLDTYQVDPLGRHLAVYLEPITDDYTDAEYVAAFTDVAKVFLPMVFKRWKGLKSFDVCLEPLPTEDTRESPPPVSVLLVKKKTSSEVAWKKATLVDILAAAEQHKQPGYQERDFHVYLAPRLDGEPELIAAREGAAARLESRASGTGDQAP
jgi:hypothetical protein